MKLLTILGPTACGKTFLSTHLAYAMGGEIISADSRQVYRGMDIGTGKDLEEYQVNGQNIPYHLIDIVEAGTKYNLFQYQQDFHQAYQDIINRHKLPILCGGTGLYIEAVLKGYELSPVPQNIELRNHLSHCSLKELTKKLIVLKEQNHSTMHNRSDVDTVQRAIRAIEIETYNLQHPTNNRTLPAINTCIIGLNINRELRRKKITERLKQRLAGGMIEEMQQLMQQGITADALIYYGLEYKYVTEYIIGRSTYQEMFQRLEIAIHQFAKRQMTWFRGMERRGFKIHWIDAMLPMKEKIKQVQQIYGN